MSTTRYDNSLVQKSQKWPSILKHISSVFAKTRNSIQMYWQRCLGAPAQINIGNQERRKSQLGSRSKRGVTVAWTNSPRGKRPRAGPDLRGLSSARDEWGEREGEREREAKRKEARLVGGPVVKRIEPKSDHLQTDLGPLETNGEVKRLDANSRLRTSASDRRSLVVMDDDVWGTDSLRLPGHCCMLVAL